MGSPYLSPSSGKGLIELPWGLSPQDLEIIFESGPRGNIDSLQVDYPYLEIIGRAGMARKLGLEKLVNKGQGNKKAYQKIKYLVQVLNRHPGFYTPKLKETIKDSEFWSKFLATRSFSVVKSNDQEILKIQATPRSLEESPLGRLETIKTEMHEELLDKMQMILRSLTSGKIARAEMGQLTKGLENLMKVYQMFKGEARAGKLIQINIGSMTLQQKKEASLKASRPD